MPATVTTKEIRERFVLRLTPAEWRSVLRDGSFLKDPDNCCSPRRLMSVPVEIVPDHRLVLG
jgi:hypothetical protein